MRRMPGTTAARQAGDASGLQAAGSVFECSKSPIAEGTGDGENVSIASQERGASGDSRVLYQGAPEP